MQKFFKWFLIIVGGLLILMVLAFQFMKHQTKKHSPETTVTYIENGKDISITYCQPYKKDRLIFGGLVPYGEVWRTGANEATTFITKTDLRINGEELKAGKYTLWTIPNEEQWQIMINSGEYGWGVDFNGKAQHDPQFDALTTIALSQQLPEPLEQFTIRLEGDPLELSFAWDKTKVAVEIE